MDLQRKAFLILVFGTHCEPGNGKEARTTGFRNTQNETGKIERQAKRKRGEFDEWMDRLKAQLRS
mgnify:FL=1